MDNAVNPLVEMIGISKSYGGVRACRDIDLTVRAGEVHALLGENGAGKSTLMKILSGDVTDYDGTVSIGGAPVRFAAPADAQRAGVAMIHQELDLVPGLTVAENIFLGRELRTRLRTVDRRRTNQVTRGLLERCGVALDPRRPVGELRTGEQQLVTIAKALSLDAKVLIMDEPTSALSPVEVEQMFTVISELRRAGVGIVYISHRMDEIGRIADRATVLRNGSVVAGFDTRDMTAEAAAEAMVGRPVQAMFRTRDVDPGEEVLRVTGLALTPRRERSGRREPDGISLAVRRGEIVGVGGLLGSGRTELLETLYGAGSAGTLRGEILFRGRPFHPRGARQSLRAGMALVPEDRRIAGLSLEHSVAANTVLSIVDRIATAGFVPRARETGAVRRITAELKVKLGSIGDAVGTLSGGNQQKVVFGRMLLTEPVLLLLDEPTRGVDVGAKAEIYQLLGEAAQQGIGVLLASSELAELVGVCDRVVVLSGGRSVRELDTRQAGEADLLAASMGEGSAALAVEGGENA
ncbi:sugar ABC transporter ATP-binding protein [Actinophytocola algeriensis]|uniref:Ribose transport system ATP-binding protein n=1 Tax=Actinophytocola algeriensis TaxID=1768010 RepID=A0A7W7QG05_9PSEU|nr:sugar ABC transporter ATP-binding protein [Actinophytocola algeriensis]MBB4912386.1 ribose transport system ATP-binding protein [Actinophytocola algeriensis]MBE1481041.1 ribose transport system ATP-binding protein [Actinophytocola algeriensis]